MKTASLKEIKTELGHATNKELMDLCLRLAKSKKENKELLTYILFESHDETAYIENLKTRTRNEFEAINTQNFHYIKKSIRKILRELKKYIRYSQNKETEVELLINFCQELSDFKPSTIKNGTLLNLYSRQIELIRKRISVLHEDLQYDYAIELEKLLEKQTKL